ncbi:type II toxin-antitoxin system VapC family toxin [Pseudanabaena yagii]|uniref:Type II toxin-antitoxin system VapC family toxin n=1 Tax=Pseudanabaena yagii GIHE-NHR1 TaxID=2722753 RepID=A0ABX1LRM0_9CYAN|nr:type II toxin-antitoxin system VapC family toxin [Pseudanabaena yagii]NMF56547.1 type II toxin-antitoxin system VapC family toxin [Pseudanabaena yagii GIHE-NHR1]
MRLLLDTHIFLWFLNGDPQLSSQFRDYIQDPNNNVYLSVVSVWEATIKYQLGKLPFPESPATYLPRQRIRHQIDSLQIDEASITQLIRLPPLHRDPFDRLLICQSIQHNLTIVTADQAIINYPIVQILK